MKETQQAMTFESLLDNYLAGGAGHGFENDLVEDNVHVDDQTVDTGEPGADVPVEEIPVTVNVHDEEPVEVVELVSSKDEDVTVNTAEILADAHEEMENIHQLENEVIDQSQTVASLESLYEILNASLENGGLTRGQSIMANNIMTFCTSKGYGLAVSVESFGGDMTRHSATVASMEGIGDMIRSIKESIKATLMSMRRRFKNWWIRINDAGVSVRKRAKALQEQIPSENILPFAKTLDGVSLPNLTIGNLIVGGERLVSELTYYGQVGEDFLSDDALEKIATESKRSLKLAVTSPEGINHTDILSPTNVYKCLKPSKIKHFVDQYRGKPYEVYSTNVLLGDIAIGCVRIDPKKPNPLNDSLAHNNDADWITVFETEKGYSYTVTDNETKETTRVDIDTKGKSVEAASKAQITKLLTMVIDISQNISDYRLAWEKREEAYANFINSAADEMKTAIREIGHELDSDSSQQERLERKLNGLVENLSRNYWSALQGAAVTFIADAYEVLNDVINYCAKSIANLKA